MAEVCANNNFEDELWEVIGPCAHLGLGVGDDNLAIYKEMQVKTQQLNPPLTKGIFNLKIIFNNLLYFSVPHITINDVYDSNAQDINLLQAICDAYKVYIIK